MLSRIKLRDFRCFAELEAEFSAGRNVFVGANAQGKTSLLEAIFVLLRLQSPRVTALAHTIRHDRRGFVLDGFFERRHLQFYYGRQRRKLALDSVEQKSAHDYLAASRAVWFSNEDVEIVRGPAERRRRFLDLMAGQHDAGYRQHLRAYAKALRSRNFLLKAARPSWREIRAFDEPLARAGGYLLAARERICAALQPAAEAAQRAIGGQRESLTLEYLPGAVGELAASLENSQAEDRRLRQTTVGPHRDDIGFALDGIGSSFASEGQQRTVALALKLADARLLRERLGVPPVLLIDDIFGELDPSRRNALLRNLPDDSQTFVTTTHLDWASADTAWDRLYRIRDAGIAA